MELEFNCPYCTVAIRVGIESAGKIGRCPKCDTKLRIPEVPDVDLREVSPQIAPLEVVSDEFVAPATVPIVAPPVASQPAAWVPSVDPNSKAEKLRRKRRQGSPILAMIAPMLFGGIFLLCLVGYWWWTQPTFRGDIDGQVLDSQYALAVTLDGPANGAPAEPFHSWMAQLFQFPVRMVDQEQLVGVRYLSKDGKHLTVLLEPGEQTELVQVPLTSITNVGDFYADHISRMDEGRQAELTSALIAVCDDWMAIKDDPEPKQNLAAYTETLAYNAHVRGLGRVCEAVIDQKLYPCVGENAQQELVFLVPKGTDMFEVRERKELRVFPSPLQVTVHVKRPVDPDTTQQIVPAEPVPQENPVPETPPVMEPAPAEGNEST